MLTINLLGFVQVQLPNGEEARFAADSARALLAYLVVESDRSHARESLAALLWPELDEKSALHNLRNALSRLRIAIQDAKADPPYLEITRQSIHFNLQSQYQVDAERFSRLSDEIATHPHRRLEGCEECVGRLVSIAALYRGDLLSGFYQESLPFEEWLRFRREHYRLMALQALDALTRIHMERGEYAQAVEYSRRQIALEPWAERAHRQLMLALAGMGRHSTAMDQYRTLKRVLAKEFGLEPSPESASIIERIGNRDAGLTATFAGQMDLPGFFTAMIGRDTDVRKITALLSDPGNRLLTITGQGGVGKTRLAVAAAEGMRFVFPDGIWFISLDSLDSKGDPAQVEQSIALSLVARMEFHAPASGDLRTAIWEFLRKKEALLVLDNLENILEPAGAIVGQLISKAPRCAVLAISRERLHLQAEIVYPLAGLQVPDDDSSSHYSVFPSTALFLDRAVRAGVRLDEKPETLQAVRDICRFVDGIPLAIELTAAQTVYQPVVEIYEGIQEKVLSLESHMQDVPLRQRSMQAVFEYSWERLSDAQREALRALSVFTDGFTIQAAQAILALEKRGGAADRDGHDDLEPVLKSLIDKSLLGKLPSGRYDFHPLVRAFAAEMLAVDQELQKQVFARHAGYFLRFLIQRESQLKGPGQWEAGEAIGLEQHNISRAVQWAAGHAGAEFLAGALYGLFLAYEQKNWFAQGKDLFGSLAVKLKARQGAPELAPALARCLSYQGVFSLRSGDILVAGQCLEESLEIFSRVPDPHGEAFALSNLAWVNEWTGAFDEAREYARRGLDLGRKIGTPWELANALASAGSVYEAIEEYATAKEYFEESLALRREIGDRRGIANSLNMLGITYEMLGAWETARAQYEEGLAVSQALGDRLGVVNILGNLGDLSLASGSLREAKRYYSRGLETAMEIQAVYAAVILLVKAAEVMEEEGDFGTSARLLEFARRHPGTSSVVKQRAWARLEALTPKLPAEKRHYLPATAEDLDSVIEYVLRKWRRAVSAG